jgi:hypothetical protein
MSDNRIAKLAKAIEKLPQWLRHDLNASDLNARERAHEALVAIIVDALGEERRGQRSQKDEGARSVGD